MKRSHKFISVALLAAFLVSVAAAPTLAFGGGAGNGNEEWNCMSGCHGGTSTATISMSASATQVTPGQQVTVTVSGSGGATVGSPFGVMINSAMTSSNSLPSADGWTIVSDPSSTAFNYNEIASYTGSYSLTWTLTAPSAVGTHSLYARVMHAQGGNDVTAMYTTGLAFTVAAANPNPSVVITSPASGATITGIVTVTATVTPATSQTISYVRMLVDGAQVGNDSAAPYSFSLDTETLTDGSHTIQVIATGSGGTSGSASVTVTHGEETPAPGGIDLTLIGIIGLVLVVIIVIAVVLMRKRG